MSTPLLSHSVVRRSLIVAAVASVASLAAHAQTAQPVAPLNSLGSLNSGTTTGTAALASPFQAQPWFVSKPLTSLSDAKETAYSSSASLADDYDAQQTAQSQLASVEQFQMPGANAFQYGQRRRYGAPRYRGGNTNPDGSEKYTGYAGGGFVSPVGDNSNFLSTSWGLQVGGGRNFNRHFGVNLEFDYDHFGVTGTTIDNQSYRYFGDVTNPYGLDANAHIWSLSVQPVYQIYSGQGLGAYITGGVGFYHKVTNFTLPQEEEYCDYYYGCGEYEVQGTFDHYTSNAPGFDGGVGLTYKFSRFANERFYAEARYVYMHNQFKPGDTNATALTYTGNNLFPENSNTTSYFPIKFGIRF